MELHGFMEIFFEAAQEADFAEKNDVPGEILFKIGTVIAELSIYAAIEGKPEFLPDGPQGTSGTFALGGKTCQLQNEPFKMVCELWHDKLRNLDFRDLAEPVWGDHDKRLRLSMVKGVASKINKAFGAAEILLHVRVDGKNRRVELTEVKKTEPKKTAPQKDKKISKKISGSI